MKSDLLEVATAFPTILTTATNDGAFWPAPQTAAHEFGCFTGAIPTESVTKPATYVEFKNTSCLNDGEGAFDDSGHDCPFKNGVEAPWILTAAKLYAQQDGNVDSTCAAMLYGTGITSLPADAAVEKIEYRSPPSI